MAGEGGETHTLTDGFTYPLLATRVLIFIFLDQETPLLPTRQYFFYMILQDEQGVYDDRRRCCCCCWRLLCNCEKKAEKTEG